MAFIKEKYINPKIALVGYQPSLLENLSKEFKLHVLDLNPANVGKVRYGIEVEYGILAYDEVVKEWADLVLCTGSTICNGTIVNFIDINKPVFFFDTTLSGAAPILGLK
ncbi:MAG: Rossmann-like domain-containing protein [Tepidanaerobacteraceae bacterium]